MAVMVVGLDAKFQLTMRMGSISTATLHKWETAHRQLTRTAGTRRATATRASGPAVNVTSASAAITADAGPSTLGPAAAAATDSESFHLVAREKGRAVSVEHGVEAAVAAIVHAAQQLRVTSPAGQHGALALPAGQQMLAVTQGARIAATEVHNMVREDLKQNAFAVLTCAAVRVDRDMGAQPQTLAARSERSATCAGGAVLDLMAAAGEAGGTWVLVCSAQPASWSSSPTVPAVVHGLSAAAAAVENSTYSTAFMADHTGSRLQVAAFCAAAVHERPDPFLFLPADGSARITFVEVAPPRCRRTVLPLALDALVLASPPGESPLCRLSAQRRLRQHRACPRPMEALRRAQNASASEVATLLLVGVEELQIVVGAADGDEHMRGLLQHWAAQSMPLSVQHRHGNNQRHDAKHVSLRLVRDGVALAGMQRRRDGARDAESDPVVMLGENGDVIAAAVTGVDRSTRPRAEIKGRRLAALQRAKRGRYGYTPLANIGSAAAQTLAGQMRYAQMAEAFAYEELRQAGAESDTAAGVDDHTGNPQGGVPDRSQEVTRVPGGGRTPLGGQFFQDLN